MKGWGFSVFVALRQLRARRKQGFVSLISLISIAGVALGVAALIVVLAVMTGFHQGVKQQILGQVPQVVVQQPGSQLQQYEQLAARLAQDAAVHKVTPYMEQEVMLMVAGEVAALRLQGLKPSAPRWQQLAIRWQQHSDMPRLLQPKQGVAGVVLPQQIALQLGVGPGDRVQVVPPRFQLTPFGVLPRVGSLKVVGVQARQSGMLQSYTGHMALGSMQTLLDSGDAVSALALTLKQPDRAAAVAARLQQQVGPSLQVYYWEQLYGSFLSALRLEKLGLFIVLTIIVLVAAFNIATTLILVVLQKYRDIAVLRAMGATARSIQGIFLLQGMIIGVLGTAAGAALGLTLALQADPIIRWLESHLGVTLFDEQVYGLSQFPSQVVAGDVAAVLAVALVICVGATLYPAWRAARTDPALALRY